MNENTDQKDQVLLTEQMVSVMEIKPWGNGRYQLLVPAELEKEYGRFSVTVSQGNGTKDCLGATKLIREALTAVLGVPRLNMSTESLLAWKGTSASKGQIVLADEGSKILEKLRDFANVPVDKADDLLKDAAYQIESLKTDLFSERQKVEVRNNQVTELTKLVNISQADLAKEKEKAQTRKEHIANMEKLQAALETQVKNQGFSITTLNTTNESLRMKIRAYKKTEESMGADVARLTKALETEKFKLTTLSNARTLEATTVLETGGVVSTETAMGSIRKNLDEKRKQDSVDQNDVEVLKATVAELRRQLSKARKLADSIALCSDQLSKEIHISHLT